MTIYQRAANPIWFFNDHNGKPLDDTYFAFFLENTLPYLPQDVYDGFDSSTANPWSNPLRFSPAGSLPDNLYFDPALVYRIEIRHGNTQADALEWLIENYVPGGEIPTPSTNTNLTSENFVTNGQFFEVGFNTSVTFTTTSHDIQLAPGWELITDAGVSSTTLQQISFSGDNNIVNNPSYALAITTAGSGNVTLRQKFNNNGALWNQASLALNVTAKSTVSTPFHGRLTYSDGTQLEILFGPPTLTASYVEYLGHVANTAASTNTDPAASAWTALDFVWQAGNVVTLTSIQLMQQPLSAPMDVVYDQLPIERQVDYEFHYYKAPLLAKPVPSYLVGWDFPLNPHQIWGATVEAAAFGGGKSKYVWDQTIIWQSVNSGIGVTQGAQGALVLTAAATTQMAIIQYLGVPEIQSLLNGRMAINVAAYTSQGTPLNSTISLWYTTGTLPTVTDGTNLSIVATVDSNGYPTGFNNGSAAWVEIPRNLGNATFALNQKVNEDFFDYNFNGWDLAGDAVIPTITYVAIVIGTGSVTNPQTVSFLSVGLMSGDVATRPAPQTPSNVLRACQYYYEKTYPSAVVAGTATSYPGSKLFSLNFSGTALGYAVPIELEYEAKRINPSILIYSPVTGTVNKFSVGGQENNALAVRSAGAAATNPGDLDFSTYFSFNYPGPVSTYSTNRIFAFPLLSSTLLLQTVSANADIYILMHVTYDARLGVV